MFLSLLILYFSFFSQDYKFFFNTSKGNFLNFWRCLFAHVGDHPEDVKARLKFWAQAVACTVRLCN